MPLLTRWYIKSSILYFVVAALVAVALALSRLVELPGFIGRLGPVYFHLFMVGWVTQMIFGVIFWMFPIITREQPRGNERVAWAIFVLLNGGLWLRIVSEPFVTGNGGVLGWLLVGSAVCQWLAGVLFVTQTWPRVRDRARRR
jgi:hypothetical protein